VTIFGIFVASLAFAAVHMFWMVCLLVGFTRFGKHLRRQGGPPKNLDVTSSQLVEARRQAVAAQEEEEEEEVEPGDESCIKSLARACRRRAKLLCLIVLPAQQKEVELGDEKLSVELLAQTCKSRAELLLLIVLPMVLDMFTDLLAACNYMDGGHVAFGTLTLTIFIYTLVKEAKTWWRFPQEVFLTIRLGYQTQGFWELRRSEIENEAVLSLVVNLFGLPWAVHRTWSLALQLFTIGLSVKGVAERLVQRDMGV